MKRSLRIVLGGEPVATIAEPRTNKFTISYEPSTTAEQCLSLRLPVSEDRYSPAEVAPFVAGLMPPLDRREELAEEHEIPPHLVFRFLELLGNDLPGGAVFVGIDEDPLPPILPASGRPITPDDLSEELAVVRVGGEWLIPDHGVPSSHLMRPEDPMLPQSAAAEALCLRMAARLGVAACDTELTTILEMPALVVARPDRVVSEAGVSRRHLEDFGQICGIDTVANGEAIYQEFDGPGFLEMAEAIADHVAPPKRRLEELAALMVLQVVVGNTNAHAASYSLLLPEREFGPLHTLLPAELYTELETEEGTLELDHRLAMSVNEFWKTDGLDHGDLVAEASAWPGLAREAAILAIDAVVDALPGALEGAAEATPEAPTELIEQIREKIDQIHSPVSGATAE